MWLLPIFSRFSSLCVRAFYRFDVDGEPVPGSGPLLLTANHPNSLVDPATVSAVANRPVRFLAKAPLFTQRWIGWLVRGAGAIPVHRRQDDPGKMDRNEATFRAAWDALVAGDAIGIFPEGRSHSEPAMGELHTGAARIALGAARAGAGVFPILPVGLNIPRRDVFRSESHAVVGRSIRWDDLAERGVEDAEAVRELTRRIEDGLRDVTLNLASWEDAPAVETAEAVHASEYEPERGTPRRMERMREVAAILAEARQHEPDQAAALSADVQGFGRTLSLLRATPEGLDRMPGRLAVVGWTLRQLLWLGLGMPLAAVGSVVFMLPYLATKMYAAIVRAPLDARSTWKILGGAVLFLGWTAAITATLWFAAGPWAAAVGLVALPVLARITQLVIDRTLDALTTARRYVLLSSRADLRRQLLARRGELAARLEALRRDFRADSRA